MIRKILVGLSGCILVFSAWGNTIVFDTLGSGGTYGQGAGYAVGFAGGFGNPYETAAQFTAETSGMVATLKLGLTFCPECGPPGAANVFLYADASGSPDNANQTFIGTAVPNGVFGATNSRLTTVKVTADISVTQGSTYWLVLKPVNPDQSDVWNTSLASIGTVDQSTNDSTWYVQHGADDLLPAFRIMTSIPDSGATFLLMLGSIGALLVHQALLHKRG